MARYSLIIRDETYAILTYEAMDKGLSMGKLLNEILDDYAARHRKTAKNERSNSS